VTLSLSSDVLFEFGEFRLKAEAESALAEAAGLLRKHVGAAVIVRGHTDSKGTEPSNKLLSLKRATAARDALIRASGASPAQFAIEGLGSSQPIAQNTNPDGSDSPEGRRKNRRVTISSTPR
jgi:outer membrane protein OmpA-like peptidoglycan-associated protein